jgi:hypothetical protein
MPLARAAAVISLINSPHAPHREDAKRFSDLRPRLAGEVLSASHPNLPIGGAMQGQGAKQWLMIAPCPSPRVVGCRRSHVARSSVAWLT